MKLLLCLFHMLKQVRTWLNDKTHFISQRDKPYILQHFKSVMYAKSQAELGEKSETLMTYEIVTKYPQFRDYFHPYASTKKNGPVVIDYRK